jgi:hypothetical protein
MNLQAKKLELIRLILDTEDPKILCEVKALFERHRKELNTREDLNEFYAGFRDGIREVKSSIDGHIELMDATTWLAQLKD